uniref:NTR domain-containing protein n=1 Tax=Tetranychus urticae TaxID=32264 RepID=T1L1Z7_TETUR
MFYTLNTRLLGVIVSLSLSLLTLAGFLIYLLVVNRSNSNQLHSVALRNNSLKLSGHNRATNFYDNESSTSMCSSLCPEKTYKDYLCDVKFVMLVNVTGLIETYETANGTITKVYSISIKKTFKKSLLFIIAFRTQRITVTTNRGCSQEPLKPGHLYFVTGRVKGLTALVDQCDLTIDWTTVNETLKEEIRLFFHSVIGSCNNVNNVINNS